MDYHTGNNMDESHKCYYQRNQTQKKYHMIQFTGNTDKTKKRSSPKKKSLVIKISQQL